MNEEAVKPGVPDDKDLDKLMGMSKLIFLTWGLATLGCCCVFPGLIGVAAVIWAWK